MKLVPWAGLSATDWLARTGITHWDGSAEAWRQHRRHYHIADWALRIGRGRVLFP